MKIRYLIPLAALILTGCSKIHEKRDFTLEPSSYHSLQITAPLSEQKLKVTMTSDQPINVYVVLDKDVPAGKEEFEPEQLKSGLLGSEKNVKEATLNVTIPAKEAYRIYLNGANKKAAVTVNIDSQ